MVTKEYNDYELLSLIKDGNEEATDLLYTKYKSIIEQNASRLIRYSKYAGLDKNDLEQEGLLGLTNAVKTFDENKEASFFTYAKYCIERRQLSAIIGSQRPKHKILNESISLEVDAGDETFFITDIIGDNLTNPENILTDLETSSELDRNISKVLTKLEKHVFDLKKRGYSYNEIAGILDISKKQVDNAISRIKVKLRDLIDKKTQ